MSICLFGFYTYTGFVHTFFVHTGFERTGFVRTGFGTLIIYISYHIKIIINAPSCTKDELTMCM